MIQAMHTNKDFTQEDGKSRRDKTGELKNIGDINVSYAKKLFFSVYGIYNLKYFFFSDIDYLKR